MKVMLMAFVATIVIAVCASYVLHGLGFSTQELSSSDAVRLDDQAE